MNLWALLATVFGAGAVGGVVNALISDNGFVLPRREMVNGVLVIRPGFLLNVFVGGIAGAVSWGLYGPFGAWYMLGGTQEGRGGLTLAALVGAVLVGVAGARWLTSEAEKKVLRALAKPVVSR
jgi:hypothetical protein